MREAEKSSRYMWCAYLCSLAIAMLMSIVTVTYFYRTQIKSFYERADASSLSEIMLHETILRREMHDISSDIRLLADNPLTQSFLDDPTHEHHSRLMDLWKRMVSERETYDQIRILDLSGMEVMRVEYNDKVPICIPDAELQDKSDRYYAQEAAKLRRGRIYVSPLDVNHEGGVPEIPFKPTIRFAIGLYDSQGDRKGSLLINYNMQQYLDILRNSSANEQADFMLVNSSGYWVMHPDREYEWGQYVPGHKEQNFAMLYPKAWEKISETKQGKFSIGDEVYDFDTFDLQGHSNFVSTRQIKEGQGDGHYTYESQLKHVAILPARVIQAYRKDVYNQCLMIMLIWLILSLIPCWGLASFIVSHYTEQNMLARQAHYDNVTGLANRVLFNERFEHALQMAERYGRICALLYIDLDGFKPINDEYGHHIGDELLATVSGRMMQCVRKTDTVARIGGDEFAILLTEVKTKTDAMLIGEKVVSRIFDPVPTSKGAVNVGASIGVAVYPEDGQDANRLMELADKYMYTNKRAHNQKLTISKDAC